MIEVMMRVKHTVDLRDPVPEHLLTKIGGCVNQELNTVDANEH
jgi:hypothetical protein